MARLQKLTGRPALASVAMSGCLLLTLAALEPAQARTTSPEAAPPAAPRQVEAPVPDVEWHVCGDNPQLRCGSALVPLDYDAPNGAKIHLNMVKRPADLPAQKIGSLFVNPGGPGGSAADFADYAASVLGAPVRQHFDVIGIDPRGIAGSTVVSCETQDGDPELPPPPREAFPRSERQVQEWLAYDEAVRQVCRTGGNAVLNHMTTADTARDMDLIRQAVGDPMLNYYGISYGTQLGSTYAAMFPGRVRSMVLDAVLDPVEWTSGRFGTGQKYTVSARLHSGYGAWEALPARWPNATERATATARRPATSRASGSEWWQSYARAPCAPTGSASPMPTSSPTCWVASTTRATTPTSCSSSTTSTS